MSYIKNTEITMASSLPEKEYHMHGFKAIIRNNTDDFYLLYLDRERIYRYIDLQFGETFVDVGANVGGYTLRVAADFRSKNVKIISIEAHPVTFKALVSNVELNSIKNIVLMNKAAGFNSGTVKMYDQIDENNRVIYGHSSIYKSAGRTNSFDVDMSPMDILLAGERADIIKIDVEGAELDVLKGGNEVLRGARKVIVEIHEKTLEPVKKLLQDVGFSLETHGMPGMQHVIGTKVKSVPLE